MENASQHQSLFTTALKGFAYTALTGALMAGIFFGVGAAALAITTAFPLPFIGTIGAASTLTSAIGPTLLVGMSTGIFGAVIQTYSAITNNRQQAAYNAAANSPINGRDIAITAASHNLYSPKLQAALDRINTPQPSILPDAAPETTQFRSKVGERPSLHEIVNRRLTGSEQTHTERLTSERAAQAETPRTLQ